jgi:hypothetical protein
MTTAKAYDEPGLKYQSRRDVEHGYVPRVANAATVRGYASLIVAVIVARRFRQMIRRSEQDEQNKSCPPQSGPRCHFSKYTTAILRGRVGRMDGVARTPALQ